MFPAIGYIKMRFLERAINKFEARERKKEKRRKAKLAKRRKKIRKIARRVNDLDLYGL